VKVKEREKVIEYKTEHRPMIGYQILSAIFSTLLFVFVYFLYILPRERDFASFCLLVVLNILSGVIGSWMARIFTLNFSQLIKTFQYINRELIGSLIYSLVVFFGLFDFVIIRYIDINTMTIAEFLIYLLSREFLEVVAILLAFKIFVYLLSDFLSDKITFAG